MVLDLLKSVGSSEDRSWHLEKKRDWKRELFRSLLRDAPIDCRGHGAPAELFTAPVERAVEIRGAFRKMG